MKIKYESIVRILIIFWACYFLYTNLNTNASKYDDFPGDGGIVSYTSNIPNAGINANGTGILLGTDGNDVIFEGDVNNSTTFSDLCGDEKMFNPQNPSGINPDSPSEIINNYYIKASSNMPVNEKGKPIGSIDIVITELQYHPDWKNWVKSGLIEISEGVATIKTEYIGKDKDGKFIFECKLAGIKAALEELEGRWSKYRNHI